MVPLYALLAAPLVRPLHVPLVLWYTHWKSHLVVRAAEKLSTSVVSVDQSSFPFASRKLRAIGHGIDVGEFECTEVPSGEPLHALVLGRYSPAKGIETILRAAALAGTVKVEARGSDETFESYRRGLEGLARELGADVEFGGPLPRAEVSTLFARSHVLVNNSNAGSADKVVFEAAASCLPVLASSPAFDDLLPADLRFERDDPASLAERFRQLDRRRRPELRELVVRNHSVEHWADGVLATVELG
jgi:glycosyltransferase involved in cell wall biosynthesis